MRPGSLESAGSAGFPAFIVSASARGCPSPDPNNRRRSRPRRRDNHASDSPPRPSPSRSLDRERSRDSSAEGSPDTVVIMPRPGARVAPPGLRGRSRPASPPVSVYLSTRYTGLDGEPRLRASGPDTRAILRPMVPGATILRSDFDPTTCPTIAPRSFWREGRLRRFAPPALPRHSPCANLRSRELLSCSTTFEKTTSDTIASY